MLHYRSSVPVVSTVEAGFRDLRTITLITDAISLDGIAVSAQTNAGPETTQPYIDVDLVMTHLAVLLP